MSQVPRPPTHILFYCEIPAPIGGATPLVISNEVYRRVKEAEPEFIDAIENQGVRYVRVIPEFDDPTSAIGRGWRSTMLVPNDEPGGNI